MEYGELSSAIGTDCELRAMSQPLFLFPYSLFQEFFILTTVYGALRRLMAQSFNRIHAGGFDGWRNTKDKTHNGCNYK